MERRFPAMLTIRKAAVNCKAAARKTIRELCNISTANTRMVSPIPNASGAKAFIVSAKRKLGRALARESALGPAGVASVPGTGGVG